MTDTRVSDADVTAAIEAVKLRLASIGVDTSKWRLVKVPGEGFLLLNTDGSGFPAETGNRQETIALASTWVGAFDVLSRHFGVSAVKATENAVETTTESKGAPVKAGAKKVTQPA